MADAKTEKQKVKEITDKLEEGLKELFESGKYKNYLSTMSKFHNYSVNNTLLIALQRPDASLVAGYQAWQKNFNRHVNKGEKGIRILAPAPYKIKEERDKLDPVTGEIMLDQDGMPQTEEVEIKIPAFRAVSVFDVKQTSGEPIPELEAKELLSTVEGYEDFVKAVTYVAPVPISFEDIPGDSKGFFSPTEKRIAVQEGMSESQTLKTMVHETAHSMLHDKEINKDILAPAKDRNTKEVEAEGIAFAECGEFHNLGEFYENIPTVDEAVAIWKQIPPERMHGIPAIGVNIHMPGTEAFEDVGIDILTGKRIDLDILEYIPDIKGNPQAMEVIAELAAKLPEMEIDGRMSEEFEAKVWEKRMPDLTPAEQLAVELDRFTYDYDTALYRDSSQSMTENVSEIAEALKQRDTHDIALWLANIAADGTVPEERKRAMELLEKLAEYKPLAKIEEMEEQNYNMVDNVLNNGAGEKAQREENRKEQERPAARTSLKARLAEKKALVSGQGKDRDAQENVKNNQREM